VERRELTMGDAVQPRRRGAAVGGEAVAALERGGERLGRQVGGRLGVARAAVEERDDAVHVAAVEPGEGRRIVRRGAQERDVLRRVAVKGHRPLLRAGRGSVTA